MANDRDPLSSAAARPTANGAHAALSAVMATGIVSVAAADNGDGWVSAGLLAAASLLFVVLGVRAARRHQLSIESFAIVAAASVLGVRFGMAGERALAVLFALLAASGWIAVTVRLRGLGTRTGTRLLAVVATEAVAISLLDISHALAGVALAWFAFGLVLYPAVMATLPPGELRAGGGDIWVAMGALAISALAAAELGQALRSSTIDDIAVVLWTGASPWGLVLVYSECRWRRLRYEPRRWATVFPLGMYATASYAVGQAAGIATVAAVSRVMVWVAFAAWALVTIGAIRHVLRSAPSRVSIGHAGGRDRSPARRRSEHALRLAQGARSDRR